MISLLPSTRVDTTSSARTSSVTFGPPVRITSMSACFSPRIPGRSERRGSMQVTTAIFGRGRPSPHAEALPPTLDDTSSHSVHWSAWSIMLMAISILIGPPTGSNRWRGLVRVRKGTTQGNTEEQGSGDQWSSESALLLIVQARNPEPVDRFLPRTEWAICRIVDGFVFEAPCSISAATSAYGTKRTNSIAAVTSANDP
jgi:hypothetical protein